MTTNEVICFSDKCKIWFKKLYLLFTISIYCPIYRLDEKRSTRGEVVVLKPLTRGQSVGDHPPYQLRGGKEEELEGEVDRPP